VATLYYNFYKLQPIFQDHATVELHKNTVKTHKTVN